MMTLLFVVCSCGEKHTNLTEKTDHFGFSSKVNWADKVQVNIRPINFELNIPRNHLRSIAHPYMPWAKAIWDKVILEAILPTLEFKNENNFQKFGSENSSNLLIIRIGFLSSDESFLGATINGEYEEVDDFSKFKLRAFINRRVYGAQSVESVKKREPNIFIVNSEHMRTPSDNPIVIDCKIGTCFVRMVIPSSRWPDQDINAFGGTKGVGLEYDFNPKYVKDWEEVHKFVLSNVKSYIRYPEHAL